jgi:hypothetical protein
LARNLLSLEYLGGEGTSEALPLRLLRIPALPREREG